MPQQNLQAVIDDVWSFLEMDPDDPASWYKQQQVKEGQRPPHGAGGMVEIYQSQSLWDNRQHPRVHGAFAQIWGTEKLWCTMDRANMKPPVREDQPAWQHPGMIHWDADTTSGKAAFRVQGVLYLADTDENGGGFRECFAQLHRTRARAHKRERVRERERERERERSHAEGCHNVALRVQNAYPGFIANSRTGTAASAHRLRRTDNHSCSTCRRAKQRRFLARLEIC